MTQFSGDVFRPDGQHDAGRHARRGVRRRHVVRRRVDADTGSFTGYILSVVGPASIAACTQGAPLRLLVDGRPVTETAVNDLATHESFDLTIR